MRSVPDLRSVARARAEIPTSVASLTELILRDAPAVANRCGELQVYAEEVKEDACGIAEKNEKHNREGLRMTKRPNVPVITLLRH